jgi:hypothetical protein
MDTAILALLVEEGDDDVALLLLDRTLRERLLIPQERFNMDFVCEQTCVSMFCCTKEGIRRMIASMRLPHVLITKDRDAVLMHEAILIVLRRLSYPNRWIDMAMMFGRSQSSLCKVYKHVIHLLYEKYMEKIEFDAAVLTRYASESKRAIAFKTGVTSSCVAFVDGTVRPIARPVYFQRQAYNGHKRVHALKFQSVTIAHGLIVAMHGPIEGRRHDVTLLRESQIGAKWTATLPAGDFIYGDPAYPLRRWLLSPFKGSTITAAQADYNKRMSSARVSVEWSFGDILRFWAFLDFKKNLKVFLSPVAKYYLVGTLLTNCLTCERGGNQTSRFFGVVPPSLEEYLE